MQVQDVPKVPTIRDDEPDVEECEGQLPPDGVEEGEVGDDREPGSRRRVGYPNQYEDCGFRKAAGAILRVRRVPLVCPSGCGRGRGKRVPEVHLQVLL